MRLAAQEIFTAYNSVPFDHGINIGGLHLYYVDEHTYLVTNTYIDM